VEGRDYRLATVSRCADEIRFGREQVRAQIERDLSQSDSMSISYDGLRVGGTGDVAWCYADVTAQASIGPDLVTMPMRFTATAQKSGDGRRFVQAHLSNLLANRPRPSPSPGRFSPERRVVVDRERG
jgi:hypothetical protein